MIPWSAAVHRGGYRRVVAVTAAQSGKTDSMLDIIGARLDQRPAPILYVGPTKEFLTDQFEPRLMALLDEAETLANKVVHLSDWPPWRYLPRHSSRRATWAG